MSDISLQDLNIVFKISERCNLKCDYCYFFFGGDDTWKLHPPLVSQQVIENLGSFAARAARDYGIENIALIFHGGEPLLMKRQRFSEMCDTLRSYEHGFRFDFRLQTNAVLVDDEWISLFERHKVCVGVSLDGTRAINDLHRLDQRGLSSYDRTVAGLRRMQEAAVEGKIVEPGLLSVINPDADGGEVYRHFTHDLGVTYMSFLTPDYTWDSIPNSVDIVWRITEGGWHANSKAVGVSVIRGVERFLLASLRAWLADKNPRIRIRLFSGLLSAMIDSHAMGVVQARDDYRHIISVSSNGDLGPEDTIKILDPRFGSMGLNVASNDLKDLFESDVWREQADAATQQPDACQGCGWWKICKADRPTNRYSKALGFSNPSLYCSGLKDVYAEIAAFLVRNGTPFSEIASRLEC
jgi:uncharacterized protein